MAAAKPEAAPAPSAQRGPNLRFHQSPDDLAGCEQGFPFRFVELGDGLRQPRPFCLAGAFPHGDAFIGQHDIYLATVGRMRPVLTIPISSSAAMVVPIDCGFMPSARARSAVVAGPPLARRGIVIR